MASRLTTSACFAELWPPAEFAEACFQQIEGFGSYGFPESHAASFALLVYVSSWLKCHYPDAFTCALLNSQPMGFYAPAQLVQDAKAHGVEIRNVDVNLSDLESVLEPDTPATERIWSEGTNAVRLGLNFVKGLRSDHANVVVARRRGGYGSIRDLWLRTELPVAAIERLAEADACRSLGLNRREALWVVKGLAGTPSADLLPLFAAAPSESPQDEGDSNLPVMLPGEEVVQDYRTTGLSLKAHPVSFLRERFSRRGIIPAGEVCNVRNGQMVKVAGVVTVRQRPGTASGVIFASIEDETRFQTSCSGPRYSSSGRSCFRHALSASGARSRRKD